MTKDNVTQPNKISQEERQDLELGSRRRLFLLIKAKGVKDGKVSRIKNTR